MVLFDKILPDGRRAGVPVYDVDDAFGDDIIREFPDGRRKRIVRGEDGVIVPTGWR